jgi:phage terminase large subunit-like protein
LREYVETALTCENYQHKGTDRKELDRLAALSFSHVPDPDRELIFSSWKKYCDENKLEVDGKELVFLRFLCQTNLYFLCNILEKYNSVTENTHEEICNSFFVRKDPANFERFEDFAKSYSGLKDRLLLVPRGGFKSSIDVADCAQWITCFPEVTILIMTATLKLATEFVGELRGHFTLQNTGKTGSDDKPIYGPKLTQDGTPSLFQVLFPEHCIKPGDDKQTEFKTPANRMPDKEATVTAASIEQALSGFHYCIMKLDDVVSNENSCTVTRLESVNRQISINKAMLHPYGFYDKIGTWYDEMDSYGLDMAAEDKLKADGEAPTIVVYLKAAWWPNEEAVKLGKIEEEMKESDWVLWFPERLSYKFLMTELRRDPIGFALKYLNDPRKVHQVKFPKELLIRRTIPANTLPSSGMIVTTVDTAYSTKSFADYTVILTSLIYAGKFYVIDMARGRYNEFELPAVIAGVGFKWKPKRIAIEDSVGVRWFSRELRREMDKLSISIPVEYVSLGAGNKTRSKEVKAKPVLRLLGDERLYFSNSCAGMEDIYNELSKFPNGTHDDIVSGLSILVDQFAAYAEHDSRINFVASEYVSDRQAKEKHDMIYGLGNYSRHNVNYAMDDNPVTAFQVDNVRETISDIDPLQDLF